MAGREGWWGKGVSGEEEQGKAAFKASPHFQAHMLIASLGNYPFSPTLPPALPTCVFFQAVCRISGLPILRMYIKVKPHTQDPIRLSIKCRRNASMSLNPVQVENAEKGNE